MDETIDFSSDQAQPDHPVIDESPALPSEPPPPIQSRFLFVDIAALRAKQLRRGARVRFDRDPGGMHKPERVAMEEVRRGLVWYDVPSPKRARHEEQA
jgi:DNA-directed RNA polymerase subunit K/omega